MTSFSQVYAQLRRKNIKQYGLLSGCCFFSVLLITAYSAMMRSPTVLTVLPEGGDSRKQVMMIFVLAVVGCAVFTTYASSLFFRYKSRETGIFLALGASKKQIGNELKKELSLLSIASCAAGMLLGGPLAWIVWRLFRLFVVDSEEMIMSFSPQSYIISTAFSVFVILAMFLMLHRFLRRTNIIDIVSESKKSEPIKDIPRWYGFAGILLTVIGGVLGYFAPSFFIFVLKWYPPEILTAVFYLPALIGMYMILLHTVVNGWRHGKSRYKNLISTSMMKFQGRQTVLNMLVVTVLLAGAYFASFYAPVLGTGGYMSLQDQKTDYVFEYRADQSLPTQAEISELAAAHNVKITDFAQQTAAILGYDGYEHVEKKSKVGVTYTEEYRELLASDPFLSESSFNALTGENIDIAPGTVSAVFSDLGDSGGMVSNDITLITNPLTGQKLSVISTEAPISYGLLLGCRVLDDADYNTITAGLTEEWLQNEVFFNVEDRDASYPFAKALFNEIVDRSRPEAEVFDGWDQVRKMLKNAQGMDYEYDNEFLDEHGFERVNYDERDSSTFRLYWKYMPSFSILDQSEFIKSMAVYLMLFVFISIICFAATFVILFTRCMTIAMSNSGVYDDLRHLGAPSRYLYKSVKNQISRIFLVPSLVGTLVISGFYTLILYSNDDGKFTVYELAGMGVCALLIIAMSALIYAVYRMTLKKVCGQLNISTVTSDKQII